MVDHCGVDSLKQVGHTTRKIFTTIVVATSISVACISSTYTCIICTIKESIIITTIYSQGRRQGEGARGCMSTSQNYTS